MYNQTKPSRSAQRSPMARPNSALIAALFALATSVSPTVALACTSASVSPERRQQAEDENLRRATLLFRGVIEDIELDANGGQSLLIRPTRSFWRTQAPKRIVIPPAYFGQCPYGNLQAAINQWPSLGPLPPVSKGMGVTLLGRPEDAAAPWNFVILVDGASDTQRVLGRLKEINRVKGSARLRAGS